MATAVQLTTTSGTLVAAARIHRVADIQNLGPDDIWVDRAGAATTTASLRVASGQLLSIPVGPGVTVTGRTTSTTQVSPDDTRVETSEAGA